MRVVKSTEYPSTIEGMCRWVSERVYEPFNPEYTTGISILTDNGAVTVLLTNYIPKVDACMTIAAVGHWSTPGAYREIFGLPFHDLGLRRVTALVAKNNRRSRRLCEGLGYKMEGVRRRAATNGQNEIIYGMLREECRWIQDVEMRKAA